MLLERFYVSCLSHASFIIADREGGEAAVIDPRRDVAEYEAYLEKHNLRLKYVLETHLHADFVSGHRELAEKTGASIVFGEKANFYREHIAVRDGDELKLGESLLIKVLETPGHTPESVCYLLEDQKRPGEAGTLFSGDTLFVGDVGRPDLLGAKMPAETLGRMLFNSLEKKIKTLPDETRVYPSHGAGSSCGKSLGAEEYTTIAREKESNYAMRLDNLEEFLREVTVDQPEAPMYFGKDAALNRQGADLLESVTARLKPMTATEVEEAYQSGAILLDTRDSEDVARSGIPGALHISLDGQFASWVGALIELNTPLVLIANEESEYEAALRCARIGQDNIVGYLEGGIQAWAESGRPVTNYKRLSPEEFQAKTESRSEKKKTSEANGAKAPLVLDVRKDAEWNQGFIPGSVHITLSQLDRRASELLRDREILVYCAGGYRSGIAVSILKGQGFQDVKDLRGGYSGSLNL